MGGGGIDGRRKIGEAGGGNRVGGGAGDGE